MIPRIFFSRTDAAIVFIAISLGYVVLTLAQKEKKPLRTVGLLIGTVIITVCALMLLTKAILRLHTCSQINRAAGFEQRLP